MRLIAINHLTALILMLHVHLKVVRKFLSPSEKLQRHLLARCGLGN